MAGKNRYIDTRFWSDGWIRKRNALERYAFLYFLTNEHSTWCGVYELDLSMMAFESGIDEQDLIRAILPRLAPKILYVDGWIFIKNFEKYHANHSEKTQKGIENAWKEVPESIRLKIRKLCDDGYPIGGVSALTLTLTSTLTSTSTPTERETIPAKTSYGEFGNVKLTTDEYQKLCDALSVEIVDTLIVELDQYIASKGVKYKNHYATIQAWARRRINDYVKTKKQTKII